MTTQINVKIIADTTYGGRRITSVEMTYPRFIHSEIMTHRMASRNAASSRAIPWPKMMARIENDPVIPIKWGAEQKGMQTGDGISAELAVLAEKIWLRARDNAVESAKQLADIGVHKAIVNRLTEPFMWIKVIYTATEWANLFRLRHHPDAEIHFQMLASKLHEAISESEPRQSYVHGPFLTEEEYDYLNDLWNTSLDKRESPTYRLKNDEKGRKIANRSAARCARISYLTHDGLVDADKDDALVQRLMDGSGFGHHSPFEHTCFAGHCDKGFHGPYWGWESWRSMQRNENLPGHIDALTDLHKLDLPE